MKYAFKSIAIAAVLAFTPTNVIAGVDEFHSYVDKSSFEAKGYLYDNGGATCQINMKNKNGSYFSLVKDLINDDLYMEIKNTDWDASKYLGGEFQMVWDFINEDGSIALSQVATADIIKKDVVQIKSLNHTGLDENLATFFNLFQSASKMVFKAEATSEEMYVLSLNGSRNTFYGLLKCVQTFDKLLEDATQK